ncbi:flagellar hook-basal body complex protein FliE [Vibrio crassostreae]|uniref:flagellar hook-basal body complex protein FliE n=1 Tax=Vibrio crassostreae TaxID=246167 RepID=UPI001B30E716|nr:flagellar hook-basal body complex protein FliE [Vibrio crassostreae]
MMVGSVSLGQQNMLAAMDSMKTRASGVSPMASGDTDSFSAALKTAVEKVNHTQHVATEKTKRFVAGDSSVTMAEVIAVNQQSSLAFEATKQVRNKLVESYKDILNVSL